MKGIMKLLTDNINWNSQIKPVNMETTTTGIWETLYVKTDRNRK
ncbi:MAG: hypothetical protein AB7E16_04735 [Candidatus Izemoplasmatales bacterium]|jgi:hypothetical protein